MKRLVDILAKEMKMWPNFFGDEIGQAQDGTLHNEAGYVKWTSEKYTLCSDYLQDKVTRAEWQAAVDALNAPKVVEWDGVGLPPVGAVCAVMNSALCNPTWERCTILYSGKHRVMYDSESCEERVAFIDNLEFRKARTILTAEQVAAEELEAIREFLISEHNNGGLIGIAKALHESGYRKEPKPCGS